MCANKVNIKNRVYNYYFDNLVRVKKLETKSILIDEKHYRIWWFTFLDMIMVKSILIKLMGKIKEHKQKKYMMVKYYVQDKGLDRMKWINKHWRIWRY